MLLRNLERISGACKVRPGDDQFGAADLPRPGDNGAEIVGVALRAVVLATKDRVGKVNSDLRWHVNHREMWVRRGHIRQCSEACRRRRGRPAQGLAL